MARKRNTLGCLFYIALVLLVLVVFLFNRTRVQEALEKTGLTRLFQHEPPRPPEVVIAPLPTPEGPQPASPPAAPPAPSPQTPTPASRPGSSSRDVVVTIEKPPAKPAAEKPTPRTRQSRLFFVTVGSNGGIDLKGVIRSVQYVDTPLTATLEALLQGPTAAERNQGLMSLLSAETRVRGVTVKDGTAVIDFSEAFRFSALGKEGLTAGLRQVVYTATEFANVKKVRILIEGRPTDYLGPEGVYVGEALSRDSLHP